MHAIFSSRISSNLEANKFQYIRHRKGLLFISRTSDGSTILHMKARVFVFVCTLRHHKSEMEYSKIYSRRMKSEIDYVNLFIRFWWNIEQTCLLCSRDFQALGLKSQERLKDRICGRQTVINGYFMSYIFSVEKSKQINYIKQIRCFVACSSMCRVQIILGINRG